MELILKIYWLWTQFVEQQEMLVSIVTMIGENSEIILLIATIVTAGALAYQTWIKRKHVQKQNMLESINLAIRIDDEINKDHILKKINNMINYHYENSITDDGIEIFLNIYEKLANQWDMGLIEIEHIYETHDDILMKIKNSERIQNYIKKKNTNKDGTGDDYFSKLLKLLDAIQKFHS